MKVLDGTIGDIKFSVNRENITRASVDAIVNGTNDKFNLKYGLSVPLILYSEIIARLRGAVVDVNQ